MFGAVSGRYQAFHRLIVKDPMSSEKHSDTSLQATFSCASFSTNLVLLHNDLHSSRSGAKLHVSLTTIVVAKVVELLPLEAP